MKNADSITQAQKDKQLILGAIAAGAIDTTGSREGVYYKILEQGSGRNVEVSDTIVAHYKGSLLTGEIFDQTKDKPATFPLGRLIKGWQVGLPLCKIGGKIRLIIPSGLAYSIRTRSLKIPPNSVLLFDIEVVEVKN
jgi:FKBP-type peptidyl-prolyl cis-trans isomerase